MAAPIRKVPLGRAFSFVILKVWSPHLGWGGSGGSGIDKGLELGLGWGTSSLLRKFSGNSEGISLFISIAGTYPIIQNFLAFLFLRYSFSFISPSLKWQLGVVSSASLDFFKCLVGSNVNIL